MKTPTNERLGVIYDKAVDKGEDELVAVWKAGRNAGLLEALNALIDLPDESHGVMRHRVVPYFDALGAVDGLRSKP